MIAPHGSQAMVGNGVSVAQSLIAPVASITKNRNDGTGPVVRGREFIALVLPVLRTSLFEEAMEQPLSTARASSSTRRQAKRDKL